MTGDNKKIEFLKEWEQDLWHEIEELQTRTNAAQEQLATVTRERTDLEDKRRTS